MALSSQTARQSGSLRRYSGERSGMSRRRAQRRRVFRIGGLLAILAGAVTIWSLRGGEASSDAATPGGGGEAAPLAALPETDRETTGAPAVGASTAAVAASNGGMRSARVEREDPTPEPTLTMGLPMQTENTDSTLADLMDRATTSRASSEREQPMPAAPPASTPGGRESDAAAGDAGPISRMVEQGERLVASNRPLEARGLLNAALHDRRATPGQRSLIRRRLSALNELLVFSPTIVSGDPVMERYEVRSGDALSRIARRESTAEWTFLMRINDLRDPRSLRVGQTLKIPTAPFHAIVDKSDFRLDLYAGEPPRLVQGRVEIPSTSVYITSFSVGLGEYGSTPTGAWIVNDTKVENPSWKNPRTGEYFSRDDPENPVGERWVGLDGTDEQTQVMTGYGIHGTIEPDSIGKEMSMGCVRLIPGEIEIIYETLMPESSVVLIVD